MTSQTFCQHDNFCSHRHYEKCQLEATRKISLMFPKKNIENQPNLTLKGTNNSFKSNIPTLAYEKFMNNELQLSKDENFVKDYYLNKQNPNKGQINIIEITQKGMEANNAYVLCENQKAQFKERQKQRRASINNCRKRAITNYNTHFEKKQQMRVNLKAETEKELKKLYEKVQQIANHIIFGTATAALDKEKQFLQSKAYLTATYLSQVKIKNPKIALNILEQIRILLQKQKLKFEEKREILDISKSASMSFSTDTSGASSDMSQSKISEVSLNESQINQQEAFINKYCDLQSLQKKWKKQNVLEVKALVRRVIAKKLLSEAQRKVIVNRNRQSQIQKKLRLENPQIAKKAESKPKQKTPDVKQQTIEPKKSKQRVKTRGSKGNGKNKITEIQQPPQVNTLCKQQLNIKSQWLKTGKFNPPGQLFDKTNNYSRVFDKKLSQMMTNLEWKDTLSTFYKPTKQAQNK